MLDDLNEELKVTKRQRIRDIMKHPENEAYLEALYDEMEAELQKKIDGLNHQIDLLSDKRNTIIQLNRTAKTAIDIFRDIQEKDKLERNDLELLIDRILVFEDHLEIRLQADIDSILRSGSLEEAVNFNFGTENIEKTLIQSYKNHEDKVFRVNVVNGGEPLEIYTDRDGEVIFKKYSPVGELSVLAGGCAEALSRTAGCPVVVCDRDVVVAAVGGARKELEGKGIGADFEALMEERQPVVRSSYGERTPPVVEGVSRSEPVAAAPILSDGDVIGAVALLGDMPGGEVELKLAMAAAGFLAKQLEA